MFTACASKLNCPALSFVKLLLSFICKRLGVVKLKGHVKSCKIAKSN